MMKLVPFYCQKKRKNKKSLPTCYFKFLKLIFFLNKINKSLIYKEKKIIQAQKKTKKKKQNKNYKTSKEDVGL